LHTSGIINQQAQRADIAIENKNTTLINPGRVALEIKSPAKNVVWFIVASGSLVENQLTANIDANDTTPSGLATNLLFTLY
jgi:hypothetical protein